MKQKNIPKVLVSGLLIMLLLSPLGIYAADRSFPQGHKHVDVNIYKVPGDTARKKIKTKAFDSKRDPREEDWYKTNIQVRHQADTALCWAFSACTAAQISYARERYEQTGQVEKVGMLSPIQLGYFFYNRVNDPLGNTAGDRNVALYDENDVPEEEYWLMAGNSCVYTMQHLATWSGAGPEPEEDGETSFKTGPDEDGYLCYTGLRKGIDPMYAYADAMVLEESTYYDSCDVATLKNVVDEYGAAVVSIFFGTQKKPRENFLQNDKDFFNNRYCEDNNHEVTVVGWDDAYPKENFKCKDRKNGKIVQPEHDGAWIVMNSWGEKEHDNGYFYVSYESVDILSDGILGLNMMAPEDSNGNNRYDAEDRVSNYQYDGSAEFQYAILSPDEKVANVYTASTDTAIDSISFTEYNDGAVDYNLTLYTELTDRSDPTSGRLMASQEFTTTTPGYKTIRLEKPVSVAKGKTFAVVITVKKAGSGGECILGCEFMDLEEPVVVGVEEGQSFYYAKADKGWMWMDSAKEKFCTRIKAQTSTHTWGAPVYQWSADNKEVTASRACLDDPAYNETETVKTTSVVSKPATITEMGDTTYTADFVNPAFESQSKTLTDIPKVEKEEPNPEGNTESGGGTNTGGSETTKKAGTLTVTAKTKTVKYKTLRKKAVTVAPFTVKKTHGKVTYKVVGGKTKSKKALKLTAKGKVTVKKKTKKGTYKIKVKVADAGNAEYKPSSKTVTVSIKVK